MLGFALRLYNLAEESLWYDELLQLDIAQKPLGAVLPALPRHAAVPLDYLTTHFWVLLGRQDYWVRLPAVFLGALALPVAFQLGRQMLGVQAGLIFMLLLTLSHFHLRYSQEVRPYALLLLGVILAGYGFWRLRATGRWIYFGLLQLGVVLFSLSHFFALAIFGPWLLFGAIDIIFQRERKHIGKVLVGLMVSGILPLTILLAIGWGPTFINISSLFSQTVVEAEQFTLAATEDVNSETLAPAVNWRFVRDQILAPLGAGSSEATLQLFNGLAGLGLIYLLLERRYKLSLLLLLWLFLPIITIVAFLIHRGEFFASRYILSVLPAYLLLVTAGILTLPGWLRCAEPRWLSLAAFLVIGGFVVADSRQALIEYYGVNEKENWRQVSQFIAQNAAAEHAVIAVNAESTLNWYYPVATAELDTYDELNQIKARVAEAERSWVVMSIFTAYLGEREAQIKAWLSEQEAIRLTIDPLISVYYLGPEATPDQLLNEIQGFALPVDHALYASLARENRRRPEVAGQYYDLAIKHAPDDERRTQYQRDKEALAR